MKCLINVRLEDTEMVFFSLFCSHSSLCLAFPGSLRVTATIANIKRVRVLLLFLFSQIPVMKACELTFHDTNCQKDKRPVTSAAAVIRSCHENLCRMGCNWKENNEPSPGNELSKGFFFLKKSGRRSGRAYLFSGTLSC